MIPETTGIGFRSSPAATDACLVFNIVHGIGEAAHKKEAAKTGQKERKPILKSENADDPPFSGGLWLWTDVAAMQDRAESRI